MPRQKFALIPAVCFFIITVSANAFAQSPEADPGQLGTVPDVRSVKPVQTPLPASMAAAGEERPLRVVSDKSPNEKGIAPIPVAEHFDQLLMSAIQERLGSNYRWGSTGPNTFDCSGFVWSSFQSIGLKFTRQSARGLFGSLPAAAKDEQFKFGTLVFFSGLTHVGIVADEHGFYHASRHNGVVYAPFNDYWLAQIDGFRRVPLTQAPPINDKTSKLGTNGAAVTAANLPSSR